MEKEKLVNFIEINHYFMTQSEMAEETGCNPPLIKRICESNGWHPITIAERMKDFIKANKHLSLDEQAEKAGITVTGLKHHYDINNIPLPPNKKENKNSEYQAAIKEYVGANFKNNNINRKAFTYYTQSGSDYLDSLNGIKTTDRNDRLLM